MKNIMIYIAGAVVGPGAFTVAFVLLSLVLFFRTDFNSENLNVLLVCMTLLMLVGMYLGYRLVVLVYQAKQKQLQKDETVFEKLQETLKTEIDIVKNEIKEVKNNTPEIAKTKEKAYDDALVKLEDKLAMLKHMKVLPQNLEKAIETIHNHFKN